MAETTGTRAYQIKAVDRQGTGAQVQMFGGTGATQGYVGIYDANGNIVGQQPRGNTTIAQLADQTAGYAAGDVVIFDALGNVKDGGVNIQQLATSGGSGSNAIWYGQQPRGAQNGSNTSFLLDYELASPYTLLTLNGITQKPFVDGNGIYPNPDYTISGTTITFTAAPAATDWVYIWYFRTGTPAGTLGIANNSTVTVWAAYTGGFADPYASLFSASGSNLASLFGFSNTQFSLTEFTSTVTLTGSPTTASFAGCYVEFQLQQTLNNLNDPNYLYIYDVYITMTLADGAGYKIIRPTSWSFYSGSQGGSLSPNQPIYAWQPSTAYPQGKYVVDSNGNVQLATNSGTSGTVVPNWSTTSGGDTYDGTMIWQLGGSQDSKTGQIANPTSAYDAEASPPSTYATLTTADWGGTSSPGIFYVYF